jgi:hypothetical protein
MRWSPHTHAHAAAIEALTYLAIVRAAFRRVAEAEEGLEAAIAEAETARAILEDAFEAYGDAAVRLSRERLALEEAIRSVSCGQGVEYFS